MIAGYQSNILGNGTSQLPTDFYGITTGTTDNYSVAITPKLNLLKEGALIKVKFNRTNTGAAFLNVDELGSRPMVKMVDKKVILLSPSDVLATMVYLLVYFQSNWVIVTGIPEPKIENILYRGLTSFNSSVADGTNEVILGAQYDLVAGAIEPSHGFTISIAGQFESNIDKTIRVYFGNYILIQNSNSTAPTGSFKIDITVYRYYSLDSVKFDASLIIDNELPEVRYGRINPVDLSVKNYKIKVTGQNSSALTNTISIHKVIIQKIS